MCFFSLKKNKILVKYKIKKKKKEKENSRSRRSYLSSKLQMFGHFDKRRHDFLMYFGMFISQILELKMIKNLPKIKDKTNFQN